MNGKLAVIILLMSFFFAYNSSIFAHVPHDVVVDLKVSPAFSLDKTIFTIINWNLFRSTDGGYEWYCQTRGLCHHALMSLAISPEFSVDKTLFVSCAKGEVYRSQDAGRSWVRSSIGLANLSTFVFPAISPQFGTDHTVFLAISPRFRTDHTVLVLDYRGDIYKTEDAGESWKRVFHEACNITAVDWVDNLVVLGTDSGELYSSEDGGTTWKKYAQHPRSQKITCIELPPRFLLNKPFFTGTNKEGVMRVVNGGSTFQEASNGIPADYITSLDSFYEDERLILFASTWHEAIFRSADNGATWRNYGTGLLKNKQAKEYITPNFLKIAIADDSTVFLGGFCGVFRSNDKGQSWYKLETFLDLILGIDLSPPTRSGFTVGITTYGSGVYSTGDDGVSWKISNRGLMNPRLGPIIYSPNYAKDRTVFAGAFGYIVKSTDRGNSWSATSIVPPKMSIEGAKIRIRNHIRQAIFESRSPMLSKLLSKLVISWLGINIQDRPWIPQVLAISPSFSVDQTIFAGMSPKGLFRSLDGGSTFSMIWNSFGNSVWSLVISPEYSTDRTLFASLMDGIYRSLDGGDSWKPIVNDLDLGRAALAISPHYRFDHTLYAGSLSGLFRTRDGGETWKKLRIVEHGMDEKVSGLAISPYFATDHQLLVQIKRGDLFLCRDLGDGFEAIPSESADSGYEFSRTLFRDSAPLIKFSPHYNEDRTVFAASMQKLVKSVDGGMTWLKIPRPLRYESEASLSSWHVLPIFLEGQWNNDYSEEYSARRIIYSSESHSEATLRFVGNGVKWIGTRGPDRGVASVFLDGEFQTKVDQYSKDREILVELFSMTGLPYGPHTIMIKVDGSRNEKSSGDRVDIDAFDISR